MSEAHGRSRIYHIGYSAESGLLISFRQQLLIDPTSKPDWALVGPEAPQELIICRLCRAFLRWFHFYTILEHFIRENYKIRALFQSLSIVTFVANLWGTILTSGNMQT